ncbi:uncharacterized protein LOC119976412 [Scyliorhinus canicula]|uniref:uncharacterized protein LOC119976412 n=1 Tax=Scyliorhinus canicula TaxID=7830 RepID=UPI0018F567F4|nr:uncharacterized protein LOC119976412 [Scyliorhinus canicula]
MREGFTEGALFADKHSPLLLSWISEGELYGDDLMLWEYIPARNETPPFQYDGARSDPNMDLDTEDGQAYQKPEKRQGSTGQEDIMPQPINIIQIVGSSALLEPMKDISTLKITWQYLGPQTEQLILQHTSYSNIVAFNSYFERRVKFDMESGSLLLKNLEVVNSGLYYMSAIQPLQNEILRKHTYFHVEVQEKLRSPQIIQEPIYILDHVTLSCIVQTVHVSSMIWQKDKEPLRSTRMRLEFDNTTLLIGSMNVMDCGMYTCIVKNEVSTNSNSHFLTADVLLFILICTVLTSIVAFVSGLTTFIAAVIIIVTLKKTQDPGRQQELTTIFVIFQVVSIISLLIACLLSVFELGFVLWCQITAGFGCFLSLVVIIYISILFLGLNTEEFQSFLSKKSKFKE